MKIADVGIVSRYRVYDVTAGQYVYSRLDASAPGDIPPDIAHLQVIGMRIHDGVLYIDTNGEPEPFLFPDEIAEILRSAGNGAEIAINGDAFQNGTHARRTMTGAVYDALEAGKTVTVNGTNILNM